MTQISFRLTTHPAHTPVAAGRLVMADTKVIDIETGYWLVGPDGQETRPAIRSFRRWVLEEAKEYCAQNGLP